jgi:hypothetical protein
VQSLAAERGRNWALPNSARGAVAITRTVRVHCLSDRLIVLPEEGTHGGWTVVLGPRTEDSVDALVSAVRDHVGSWGIAGHGMYWRPVLQVDVAPDAGQRLADLIVLLDGSGLTVSEGNEER